MTQEPDRGGVPETEAADWYARLNADVVDNADLDRFKVWRQTPENRAAYDRVSSTAARMAGVLREDPELNALADRAIARGQARRGGGGRRRWVGLAAGGAVALAVCLAAALVLARTGRVNDYVSGVGERRVIVLEDGSRMTLNTDSLARVRFVRDARRVTLVHGQAFFEVAHAADRPFLVEAGDTEVRAIGTKFDVFRDGEAVRVVLTQGRIQVRGGAGQAAGAAKAWTLDPGQTITVGLDATPIAPAHVDALAETSWTSGQLTFQDTALRAAVAEVNRYSRRKIVLAPDAPADSKINGVFATGDPQAFAEAAAVALGLRVRPGEADRITLEARAGS